MSGGRSRTADTKKDAMNMRESQTDWTHVADKAATTANTLYVSGADVRSSDDDDKTKCSKIRKMLWITIDTVFAVAIVVVLAYCGATGLLGSTEEKISLEIGGQTGLPGSTGSSEGNGSVGMDGQPGLPGSTGFPEGNGSVEMGGQTGLPGSPEGNGSVGMDGQHGLPGSTGSPEGNGSVEMDGQPVLPAGLPGSTGSPEEKGHVGMGGQVGLLGSTGEKVPLSIGGETGLPGSTGSKSPSCGIQWVMMAMGDGAGITWSIGSHEGKGHVEMGGQAGLPGSTGSPEGKGHVGMDGQTWLLWYTEYEENGHVEMDGQAGLLGSTGSSGTSEQGDGNMGKADAAAIAVSGPQELVRQIIDQLHPNEECVVEANKRQDCGWPGITPEECRRRGCCFNSMPFRSTWCFFKQGHSEEVGYTKWRGIYYKAFKTHQKSFSDAAATCREDGGTLAMPRDHDTDSFLFSLTMHHTTTGQYSHPSWFGLKRRHSGSSEFVWVDGTPLGGYTGWRPDEPNNWGGNEDCVHYLGHGDDPMKWNDIECGGKKVFICQRP
ncbi:uncharacterized protein LOC144903350 [Branchiostoma floridae x Branchiostoma belcheri]